MTALTARAAAGANPGSAADPAGTTMVVTVPLAFRRRGGRKRIVTPDGSPWSPSRPEIDSTLVAALARAFRWRRLLEHGHHATVTDLAAAEGVTPSYVARVLRLTLLAPAVVEAILDGRQGPDVTLARLMRAVPVEWGRQRPCKILPTRPEPCAR